jgi:tetratricopeptide (TPR) repeat protein
MDLKQEIRSFSPIDIDKLSQENGISEKRIDSVKAYNKAIDNLRSGSEDIAMIELKKVVSTSPDFYEAINLLGLCYAYTNQIEKAEVLFEKAADGENSAKAVEYLSYITRGNAPGKTANKAKAVKTQPKSAGKKPYDSKPVGAERSNVQTEYILLNKLGEQLKKPKVAVGINIFSIICLIAAISIFISMGKGSAKQDTAPDTTVNSELNEKYNKAAEQNKALQKELDTANQKLKQIEITSSIAQVSTLYGQGKYVEAADKLLSIPVSGLPADSKKKYDSLKSSVLKNAASKLTTEGSSLYNKKKYADAVKKLEKVFTLGSKWPFGDKALYILGKSYVEINDLQKGAQTYQKLIQEYPQSSYVKYAKSRLDAIQ